MVKYSTWQDRVEKSLYHMISEAGSKLGVADIRPTEAFPNYMSELMGDRFKKC